jgi:1,5-anhydro-D-fructose reductase (1,5-anhydro-D-mannitol-forming)
MSFAHTHAAAYARLLRGDPDIEVRGADPGPHPGTEVRGRALARELGIGYCDSYAELLDWGPDAVLITSENARHRPLAELAASRGAHILCEKPLATTWADGRAIVDAAAVAGVLLMMAYPVRFASAFARLRADYAAGRLGELLAIRGTNNGMLPGQRAWFADPELAGGGALVDHVVHIADLIEALTGDEPVSVTAVSNRKLHAGRAAAETAGLVLVSYASGFSAAIDCSWSRPATAPTWGGLTLSVAGTLGTAEADFFGPRSRGLDAATGRPVELPYGPDFDAALLAAFLTAVRTGEQPQPDGRAGLRTLEVMLGAQLSARTGQTVTLASSVRGG